MRPGLERVQPSGDTTSAAFEKARDLAKLACEAEGPAMAGAQAERRRFRAGDFFARRSTASEQAFFDGWSDRSRDAATPGAEAIAPGTP